MHFESNGKFLQRKQKFESRLADQLIYFLWKPCAIKMNKYLKEAKALVSKKRPILAVIGNESCDLDSAVSSISFAFHLHNVKCSTKSILFQQKTQKCQLQLSVIPIVNVTRENFPLKTEVTHWLKKHEIDLCNLICRDELQLNEINSFILVDHHVSPFHDKVISVLDHRPFDKSSQLREDCIINIQDVGSCSTLIVDAIRNDVPNDDLKEEYSDVLKICYGPIVLDTINFSASADKARRLDFEVAEMIEKILNIENHVDHRKKLYEELVEARADISGLDSLQILSKDLKFVSGNGVRVAIPGIGDVFKYTKMNLAAQNLQIFAETNNVDVVVIMGMIPAGDSIERHLGVVNIKNPDLYERVS